MRSLSWSSAFTRYAVIQDGQRGIGIRGDDIVEAPTPHKHLQLPFEGTLQGEVSLPQAKCDREAPER